VQLLTHYGELDAAVGATAERMSLVPTAAPGPWEDPMTVTPVLPATAQELKARFAFRPEIALLYDRRHGLEHRLNASGVAFVAATFDTPDPVTALADRYAVPATVLAADLSSFWQARLDAPTTAHPQRKSGAPADWAATDVPFPLALEVELTRACNWHCDFCYNVWKVPDDYGRRGRSDTGTDPAVHMPLDVAGGIIHEAATNGCLRLRLSGGEPTMHPHYRHVITTGVEAGLDVELFTNGTRLDDTEAAWLARIGVRVVLLSVHGLPDTHTTMTGNPAAAVHAWRGLRAATAAGLTTVAETLVCEDNVDELPELVSRLVDDGVGHVSFMPYVPFSASDPRRPVALRRIAEVIDACRAAAGNDVDLKVPCAPRHCLEPSPVAIDEPVRREFDDHCAAGILWASVSYDGRFRHCPHSSVYAGHIDDGMKRLWNDLVKPTVRAALAPSGACAGCGQFAACGGGCHLPKVVSYASGTSPAARPPAAGRRLLPLHPTGTVARRQP
jgi:radical SAM protein with 4Fe4S-binding SPASM domain